MRRVLRFVTTPFGVSTLLCLALAGWALWSGGVADNAIERKIRSASVYAAPGTGLDVAAAERVIGNRRLIVLLLPDGTPPRDGCRSVGSAADGTLVLALSRSGTGYERYGCARLPGVEDENFGRAVVAETTVGRGVNQFPESPLEAIKLVVINYDTLVQAGIVPRDARTISPSLPRYLVAAAAILAVLLGSLILWLGGRRAGRAAAHRRRQRENAADARTALSAAAAVLAQQIIDLDGRYRTGSKRFARDYRRLTSDYLALLEEVAGADDDTAARLTPRVEQLTSRARALAA